MISLVLTVIGPDKTGIVELLSEAITKHDANWVESRMSQLAGQFAGILRVLVPKSRADGLAKALEGLIEHELRVIIARSDSAWEAAAWQPLSLDLVGADHPGIVHEVSEVLVRYGVNVEDLSTECVPAPMSGEPLFTARATLRAPPELDLDDLHQALERIAADLMVELSLDS